MFEACLRGDDDATTQTLLRARGLLPSGPLGRRTLEQLREGVMPYAAAFGQWRGDAATDALPLEVDLDGALLQGRIGDVYPHGIARIRFDVPNGPSAIRNGLDWLFASAHGRQVPLVEFHDGGDAGVGPHVRQPLDVEAARDLLRTLLALREAGLREPLPFAPYAGWELFNAPTLEKGLDAAAKKWRGSERSWSEADGDALRLALRGRDPFGDDATQLAFVDLALTVYRAVARGETYAGTDRAALRAMAANLDVGEAE